MKLEANVSHAVGYVTGMFLTMIVILSIYEGCGPKI